MTDAEQLAEIRSRPLPRYFVRIAPQILVLAQDREFLLTQIENQDSIKTVLRDVIKHLKNQAPHCVQRCDGYKCCNPECGGHWGTGCYCCHHGKFHPLVDRVREVLK